MSKLEQKRNPHIAKAELGFPKGGREQGCESVCWGVGRFPYFKIRRFESFKVQEFQKFKTSKFPKLKNCQSFKVYNTNVRNQTSASMSPYGIIEASGIPKNTEIQR